MLISTDCRPGGSGGRAVGECAHEPEPNLFSFFNLTTALRDDTSWASDDGITEAPNNLAEGAVPRCQGLKLMRTRDASKRPTPGRADMTSTRSTTTRRTSSRRCQKSAAAARIRVDTIRRLVAASVTRGGGRSRVRARRSPTDIGPLQQAPHVEVVVEPLQGGLRRCQVSECVPQRPAARRAGLVQ